MICSSSCQELREFLLHLYRGMAHRRHLSSMFSFQKLVRPLGLRCHSLLGLSTRVHVAVVVVVVVVTRRHNLLRGLMTDLNHSKVEDYVRKKMNQTKILI